MIYEIKRLYNQSELFDTFLYETVLLYFSLNVFALIKDEHVNVRLQVTHHQLQHTHVNIATGNHGN